MIKEDRLPTAQIRHYKPKAPKKYLRSVAMVGLITIAGCQTTSVPEKLRLVSTQFPESSLNYHEKPASALERQKQRIDASHGTKILEVIYLTAGSGYVWLRPTEELPEKGLRGWNRMKDALFSLGSYHKVSSSLGQLNYRRFTVGQRECAYFGKYFGWSTQDDTSRPTKMVNGYFCEGPSVRLTDSNIAELLQGFSLTRETPKPETALVPKPQEPIAQKQQESAEHKQMVSSSAMTRELSGTWEGVSKNLTGTFSSGSSKGRGRLTVALNELDATCTGQWIYAKGQYNTNVIPQGTWSVACDNGLTAGGTYLSKSPTQGTIEGEDAKGRELAMNFKEI